MSAAGKSEGNSPTRRDQILDETVILAGQRGYHGFSFKDLAERCQLTKQGVLHYFPSKEALLLALLDERDASLEADLLDILASGGFEQAAGPHDGLAILRASLATVICHMLQTPELIRLHVVLRAEAIDRAHPASGYFIARDRDTRDWLAQRLAPFCDNADATARHVLAAMIGLQQLWLQEEMAFDLAGEWRSALEKLLPDRPVIGPGR